MAAGSPSSRLGSSLNVGDTYFNKWFLNIPGQIEWQAARDELARGAIGSSGRSILMWGIR